MQLVRCVRFSFLKIFRREAQICAVIDVYSSYLNFLWSYIEQLNTRELHAKMIDIIDINVDLQQNSSKAKQWVGKNNLVEIWIKMQYLATHLLGIWTVFGFPLLSNSLSFWMDVGNLPVGLFYVLCSMLHFPAVSLVFCHILGMALTSTEFTVEFKKPFWDNFLLHWMFKVIVLELTITPSTWSATALNNTQYLVILVLLSFPF